MKTTIALVFSALSLGLSLAMLHSIDDVYKEMQMTAVIAATNQGITILGNDDAVWENR